MGQHSDKLRFICHTKIAEYKLKQQKEKFDQTQSRQKAVLPLFNSFQSVFLNDIETGTEWKPVEGSVL